MRNNLSYKSGYHNDTPIKRPDTPLAETPTAREYLASGKPTGGNKPSPKKEITAKEYLASGKATKPAETKVPEGYSKVKTGPGVYEIKKIDKAKEYLAKK